jgi:NAD(P)-dependent dehydrogenase (short-subunit alcohol dehydrogenase family)
MSGRICLVTGASSGIGRETAAGLARMGATVVMTARDPARGEAALEYVRSRSPGASAASMIADFASLDSVRRLAEDFRARYHRLHVLVNNAGAYNTRRSVTVDGFETTFAVNYLAHFLLTNLLLDALKAGAPSRIVNVSSVIHGSVGLDLDDLNSERGYRGMRTYARSKLAIVLFTYELARRLEGTGVTANCLHPGVVRSGFGLNNRGPVGAVFRVFHAIAPPFILTPSRGADTPIYLASSPEVEGVTGKYFVRRKVTPTSRLSRDETLARRLWEISEKMVGLGEGNGRGEMGNGGLATGAEAVGPT